MVSLRAESERICFVVGFKIFNFQFSIFSLNIVSLHAEFGAIKGTNKKFVPLIGITM